MAIEDTIAKNLRRYREQAGISVTEMARRLKVRIATVSDWELGKNEISAKNLKRFADECKVPEGKFYEENPPERIKEVA